jgi:hypothetical protein
VSTPSGGLPSPDLSGYNDLKLYDRTDQQIIATALGRLQLDIPELEIREGATEIMLIESLALEISEGVVAVNRLPGAVIETLLHLAQVDKDYGAPAFATATITLGDTLGHTIPGGTRLYLPLADGSAVTFLVEPPNVTVAPGDDTAVLNLVSSEYTDRANGMPILSTLVPADPLPFIERVQLASTVVDGRSAESDAEWRDRGVARLSRLSDALVVPRHFEAAALERPEVGRALALDNYDPTVGPSPGDNPGHVTVAVLGDDGTALSSPAKAAIDTALEERAAAMLQVHVIDISIQAITTVSTVVALPGFDHATVETAVEDAVDQYFDPLTWTYGQTIYHNEMVSLIDRVPGVDRVVTVTVDGSSGDVALTNASTVPDASVTTITVT